jgi:hypothetical protein
MPIEEIRRNLLNAWPALAPVHRFGYGRICLRVYVPFFFLLRPIYEWDEAVVLYDF